MLYHRSISAPRVRRHTSAANWKAPANWYKKCDELSKYEKFLWETWGPRLYEMVKVNKEKILLFEVSL